MSGPPRVRVSHRKTQHRYTHTHRHTHTHTFFFSVLLSKSINIKVTCACRTHTQLKREQHTSSCPTQHHRRHPARLANGSANIGHRKYTFARVLRAGTRCQQVCAHGRLYCHLSDNCGRTRAANDHRHYSLEVMSKCSINSRARSIFHRQHARGRGVRQPATGSGYDDNLIYAHGCRVVPGIFPGKSIDFEMRKNGHSRELCAQRVANTSYDDAQHTHTTYSK